MIFDIHSHIVPGVDDGVKSVEEALECLKLAEDNGIDAIIATPHFWHDISKFDEFDRQVNNAFFAVRDQYEGKIELYKGYEVKFFKGISKTEKIRKMTLNNSEYLLLELNYSKEITDDIVKEIADIYYNFRITPILAHLERYHENKGYKKVLTLVENGIAMAQVNATSFFTERKKTAVNLLHDGLATLIATDMHSPGSRPPKMKEALICYHDIFGSRNVQKILDNFDRVYNQIILK